MENLYENKELITQFMNLLEQHFGPNCEIILHDFSKEYDHTIVDIRNGHVTGRSIGGCATNIGLEIMKGTMEAKDTFNYVTYAPNGKLLRSSSIYFKNSEGKLLGSICVNLDITETVQLEKFLSGYNRFPAEEDTEKNSQEFFVENVHDLLDELIRQELQKCGKSPKSMSREEKIQFIAALDEKGAFIITNSSKHVCALLDISRYTFYNYLDLIHRGKKTE